jgi:CRISPR system Cascade subunit CasD
MRFLLLRLEGPILSFGDVVIDESLQTARFPALSMVCGLLANAAGLDRNEPRQIQELQDAISVASRIDRPGKKMHDYQTALLHSGDSAWTSSGRVYGRDGGFSGAFTAQMEKDYWADASVTVAVSMPDECIDRYAAALDHPARVLFLGRKSCPPSRPILLGIMEAQSLLRALEMTPADHGLATVLEAQWPVSCSDGRKHWTSVSSDLKDWRNRVHVGLRTVQQGHINVEARP